MDSITQVLADFQHVIDASPMELWLKAIFGAIVLILGVVAYFNKKKIRKQVADNNENRDREQNIEDNERIETQSSQDGQSVRDRIRRGDQ